MEGLKSEETSDNARSADELACDVCGCRWSSISEVAACTATTGEGRSSVAPSRMIMEKNADVIEP